MRQLDQTDGNGACPEECYGVHRSCCCYLRCIPRRQATTALNVNSNSPKVSKAELRQIKPQQDVYGICYATPDLRIARSQYGGGLALNSLVRLAKRMDQCAQRQFRGKAAKGVTNSRPHAIFALTLRFRGYYSRHINRAPVSTLMCWSFNAFLPQYKFSSHTPAANHRS